MMAFRAIPVFFGEVTVADSFLERVEIYIAVLYSSFREFGPKASLMPGDRKLQGVVRSRCYAILSEE